MTIGQGVRIRVSRDACIGAGLCVAVADTVFDQDEHGIVVLIDDSPGDSEQLRNGVAACPAKALGIEDPL